MLVRKLSMENNHPLKPLLNIVGKANICEESLALNGSARRNLVEIVPDQLQQTTSLLLKGQTDDFRYHVPEDLRHELPQVQYLLVFLWVAPEIQLSRVHSRIGGNWSKWQPRDCAYELDLQIQETEKLRKSGFAVHSLDSSNETYTPLDWQTVLNKSNVS